MIENIAKETIKMRRKEYHVENIARASMHEFEMQKVGGMRICLQAFNIVGRMAITTYA